MIVRKATSDDFPAIAVLFRQINALHHQHVSRIFNEPSDQDQEYLFKNFEDDSRTYLVAENEGVILGFVLASITKNETVPFLSKEPVCWINTIVVDHQRQASGVGKRLMEACQDWANSRDVKELRLEVLEFNSKAQSFYDSLGFKPQARVLYKV
ncbi:GNAT family N-acetyltransferase [Parendozoicomonas haliclonae]|uniref:Aminoglycoside N(6')-acetyltransferase type 1 n=1 Tax=Parendozoicomonas haliclonae TaxID=1960125 RepID=A0A1X7AN90_9GAMM|nr:GNAT family N-acetyltransferase [Parendozoicomonas haliclonae]SMA48230.1 Aminoglycoside N(6')-acetyltransferase type 1 [Parendozoicomonas haliclonae]